MTAERTYYTTTETPLGRLLVAGTTRALTHIGFQDGENPLSPPDHWELDPHPFLEVVRQLHAYFQGRLKAFELPLAPEGSPFQLDVWQALTEIPYGATVTYGEIARRIDKPDAARAVGGASRRNPLPIVIPCHRVVGKSGSLTGFSAGIDIKQRLLSHEQRVSGHSYIPEKATQPNMR
jgi:methylated-DNA-[protein]-cysteine S-methyltransferase